MLNSTINIENLCHKFNINGENVSVLNNTNAIMRKGEIFGVVGPSGCGKSTLLHIIGGLLKPTSGNVFIDEHNLYMRKTKELNKYRAKHVGFVFQLFYLIPGLNALENVMLPMYLTGKGKLSKKDKAKQLLDAVDMTDRYFSKPSQLSGGEQQRVAIARALANNPDIILADEPTGNLDSNCEKAILDIFRELKAKNKLIIIVTHSQNVAEFSDDVLILSK